MLTLQELRSQFTALRFRLAKHDDACGGVEFVDELHMCAHKRLSLETPFHRKYRTLSLSLTDVVNERRSMSLVLDILIVYYHTMSIKLVSDVV
ncbi:hypothetical protein Plhal304r1_c007g0028121 [Plasmopara halstedii]